ncbi:MAG: hypothetical protein ACON39_04270 [Coraliomargaritaceae bacterium]
MKSITAFLFLSFATALSAGTVHIVDDSPQLQFGLSQVKSLLPSDLELTVSIDEHLGEQAYRLHSENKSIQLLGGTPEGLMYGCFDLAERIRFGEDASTLNVQAKPHIKRRGLKMNIPLDARCPSYDDSGTSARMNIEQVWSEEFWHGFLDRMAEHRYNTLTLWSNHPFSTMLRLEDYPEVALDDIAVPTYELDDQMLPQYMQAELQNPDNYSIVKKIPIEEKIDFWRAVMRYAKERGIDIYFITWNIWVHGAEGKYGINASQTNPYTVAYLRECVKQFVLTYPDLKGLGITCGEHMQNKLEGEYSVEKWMWKTYGLGILDAKAEQPGREVDFIHRVWYTGMDVMMDDFIRKYPDTIHLGFKYARARLYSIPNPPFFEQQLKSDCEKYAIGCWMNLRNDDIFCFRWGDPDYVRTYMKNLPPEPLLAGYHMGSDGYVWGREFTSLDPNSPRQLEIDKHWYNFMLWGRLGYDPNLGRDFFERQLLLRFPKTDVALLYNTWQNASQIIPLINVWHWRDWDHMWSPEACTSKKEGYHSVDHFIEFWPLQGQNMQSIRDYVEKPKSSAIGPMEVADQLDALATETLSGLRQLETGSNSKELRKTCADMKAFARLGQYYADKIRGSTSVHQFRVTGDPLFQKRAVKKLEAALAHWEEYAAVASKLYAVQLLARTSYLDWNGSLLEAARKDIEIAKQAVQGKFPPSVIHSRKK